MQVNSYIDKDPTYSGFRHNRNMSETIWDRIIAVRELNGRVNTQTQIAIDLGIKQSSVHMWATGKGDPTPKHIRTIANQENACVEFIETGRGPRNPMTEDVAELVDRLSAMSPEERERLFRIADALE